MYFVHTWAQRLLGKDLQEDHIKLDLEMTLTVKVKLLNYAKNTISLLIMSRVHSYFDKKNAYRGTETLKLRKIKLKF